MNKVYLVSAKRSAIGSMLESLKDVSATWLGSQVLKAVIEDAGIDAANLDEVIVGNVLPAGLKQGPARQVAIGAGVPVEVPAYSLKNIYPGRIVATFAMGNRELYDFIDDNPGVAILDGTFVNDPYVIAQNDNQISINSTIEVDLFGQCCSESVGTRQFSGTGGQVDTAVGAQMSKGGRSVIATYSTANIANKATGEKEEVSKIVSTLKPGATVSLSRNDIDWLVTEYGAVCLRGTSSQERAKMIISVAHPKFRDQLLKEAIELGIIGE